MKATGFVKYVYINRSDDDLLMSADDGFGKKICNLYSYPYC